MKALFPLLIFSSLLFYSCGNQQHEEEAGEHVSASDNTADTITTRFKNTDSIFLSGLDSVLHAYLSLKDALVASNMFQTQAAAKKIISSIGKINVDKLDSSQRKFFETESQKIKEKAELISSTALIETQRNSLNDLSAGIFSLLNSFGSKLTIYYSFCPMANNDSGGYWVSESPDIQNPYFGDKMLNCGEVKKVLR